ncbi:AzlC family ABC transporter permease [Actinokineospora inagensis]|uniref:AzlC family ABC transporter permease n=1 Tax=Actinokineospora inagensis TaxID=103730 RepID=UPI000479EB0E|nr:AzlC family ABC transporter permease [Actinokineospora inagensis]
MRSIWRTLDAGLWRGVLAIAAAAAVNGASFGAIAVAAGLPLWVPVVMSLLVFAGGSQYLVVGVVAAGGSPIAAVLGGLVLNARHLPFGLAVGEVVGNGWGARLLGSHLLIDESVAFAMAQSDRVRARAAYWACGGSLFIAWNVGVAAGALAGTLVDDPSKLGLDAVFPAVMLALVLPALKEAGKWRPALLGAAAALATTPFLPAGVPVLVALVGLLAVPRRADETDQPEAVTA